MKSFICLIGILMISKLGWSGDIPQPSARMAMGVLMGKKEITVKAKAQGEVMKIHFEEGQAVKENETIALIDDRQKKIERDLANVEHDMSAKDYQKSLKLGKFISKDELQQKEGAMIKKKSTFQLKEVDLANTRIRGPISGVITKIYVDQGETVAIGDKVVEVVQLDELILQANLPAQELHRLSLGSIFKFKVQGLEPKEFDAVLSFVSPIIDPATDTARVKFQVRNPTDRERKGYVLKPGMVAQLIY